VPGAQELFFRYVIPSETYPGQAADVVSVAHPNLLLTRADVDAGDVCWVTKSIFDNLELLSQSHPAGGEIRRDKALPTIPVPIHPGAKRYFETGDCPNSGDEATDRSSVGSAGAHEGDGRDE